ncbi:MAG: HAMP domain-containing protein [Deltaproteobacteria bacterium]|nr:HAMP domain-containing protein [Deltaproteobacteria bacterium]
MSREREPRMRWRYVINPQFQFKWALFMVLAALASSAIVTLLVLNLVDEHIAAFVHQNLIGGEEAASFLKMERLRIAEVLWTAFGAIFISLMLIGVWATHRISGPLFAMRRHMERIVQGRIDEPLHVRSGDEFRQLVEVYNEMVVFLRMNAQRNAEKLSTISKEMEHDPDEAKELLDELAAAHRHLAA